MDSKVAAVEDYDSVIQEAIPTSRREAFKKRASGLHSVTNSSDTGTIDSGYSSNSTANILAEHFGESPPRPDNPGELSHIDESTATRPTLSHSSSSKDGRTSRPLGHSQRSSGSYSYGPGTLPPYRPASRAASKSMRDGRASPAVRCPPPINTGVSGGDECDCKDCNVKSAAQPSPMLLPTSAGLESSWTFDLRNNLPYSSNGTNSWTTPLSTSPGHSRGMSSTRNGFPFETFSTSDSANPAGSLGSSHSLNYNGGTNPLVNPLPGWTTQHEYTASPDGYTSTTVNPLHSPPPYRGSSSSWMAPPPTPGGLGSAGALQSYDDYDYQSSQDYMYGVGSGAMSANNGLPGPYDLPPRSASVQPLGSTRSKRSNTYHHLERNAIPDFSAMPPPHPSHRRSNSRVPTGKKIHSATNSHDNGYESFDVNPYDSAYIPTFDEYAPPPPNRRLSRSSATPPQYPDIARATSVPPVDNYITNIDKARRMSSMTPQPLAITQRERERNRRGSNSSSGLSAARRAAHELQLDQLAEQVVIEKKPDLALTKRNSNPNRHEHVEPSYLSNAYDNYEGYPAYEGYGQEYGQEYAPLEGSYESSGMDLGAREKGMVLRGDNSDPYAVRYPGVGVSSKLPASASHDPYHRPARMNVERRKSMHRRNSDFPHSRDPLASGAELELMRTGSVSRGSGADKRMRRQIEYDLGGYY